MSNYSIIVIQTDKLISLIDVYKRQEFYIPVLEAMIASPVLDETEKIRPQARLKLAQKNRIGTKALDFTYTCLLYTSRCV